MKYHTMNIIISFPETDLTLRFINDVVTNFSKSKIVLDQFEKTNNEEIARFLNESNNRFVRSLFKKNTSQKLVLL